MIIPITKTLKAVASCASPTDNTRYALPCVRVEADGTIVATDGIKLISVKDGVFGNVNNSFPAASFHASDILAVKVNRKDSFKLVDITPEVAAYPEWREVMPKYDETNSRTVTVNARYLVDLLKAIQTIADDKDATVDITISNSINKPLTLTCGDASALLMPIRK